MENLAQFIGAYAVLLLAGTWFATLLTLLLVWTWARRHGRTLQHHYYRAADWLHRSSPMRALHARAPALERVSLRTAMVWIPLLAFTVIVIALNAFGELADGIGPNEELHRFDNALAAALLEHSTPAVHRFFGAVTHLGDWLTLAAIGIAVALALLVRRRGILLYGWILALAGSGLLNVSIKAWFARARPGEIPLLDTWSFPSGHAMNSLVAYGMLVYLLSRVVPHRWMGIAIAVAVTIVMMVGASRMFLHLHYFSDVLAGFAAGLAWLAVCIAMTEVGLRRAGKRARPNA